MNTSAGMSKTDTVVQRIAKAARRVQTTSSYLEVIAASDDPFVWYEDGVTIPDDLRADFQRQMRIYWQNMQRDAMKELDAATRELQSINEEIPA